MAPILTPEDVVRRIAAECAFVDERGGVGIRLKPAAAIVRRYGEQFRAPRRQRRARSAKPHLCYDRLCLSSRVPPSRAGGARMVAPFNGAAGPVEMQGLLRTCLLQKMIVISVGCRSRSAPTTSSQGRLPVDTGPSKERETRIRAYSITASAWARIDWKIGRLRASAALRLMSFPILPFGGCPHYQAPTSHRRNHGRNRGAITEAS